MKTRKPGSDVPRRFLTQQNLGEIRWGVAVANSQARREGKVPKGPQIHTFSCPCNCFHIKVD